MRGLRSTDLQDVFQKASDWEGYLSSDPEKAGPWRTTGRHRARRWAEPAADWIHPDHESAHDLRNLVWRLRSPGPRARTHRQSEPCIDLRYVDRDAIPGIMNRLSINGGQRVPMVVFMAEDWEPVSVSGDRTLNYYRHMMNSKLGISCPMPGAATDAGMIRLMTQDWIDEFERVHLL